MSGRTRWDARIIFGGLLILLGVLFVVGNVFGIRWGNILWPFFILVPGGLLFLVALSAEQRTGEALVFPASILTMLGLLFLYQSVTGHWESWAYAWALLAPTSIGLGLMIYGSLKGLPRLVKSGLNLAIIGGIIFVVGAVFFELIIGISGFGLGGLFWPILLIVLGGFLLLRTLLPRR